MSASTGSEVPRRARRSGTRRPAEGRILRRAGAVWGLHWRLAAARRRLLLWNVAIPLALLAPVALAPAAAPHRAAVYAVFLVLFGTFGACIPLVRDGRSGWTEKLLLTGYGPRLWLAERTAAEAALDLFELFPALGILLVVEGAGPEGALRLVAAAALALTAANLLGTLAAGAVRSLAEGALASAAIALIALHLAGAFRSPEPGTWAALAERWSPFRPLHESLLGLSPGAPDGGVAAGGWGEPAACAAALALLVLAAAPLLERRLADPGAAD